MDREQNTPNTSCEQQPSSCGQENGAGTVPPAEECDCEASVPCMNEAPSEQEPTAPEASDEPCIAEQPEQPDGNCYTAVEDGQQNLNEEPAAPDPSLPPVIQNPSIEESGAGAPENPSGKKKSKLSVGTKLLIVFVAVMATIIALLFSISSVLFGLLITRGQFVPSVDQTPDSGYSEESKPDSSPNQGANSPSSPTETPPPSNYESDSWYNPDDLTNDELSAYEKVCAMCNPSIVAISTDVASGSGVVWTSDGYIVTNNHVVEDASSVSVMLSNGKKYPATVINTNVENDLALIRINVTGLLPATLGDSDKLRMGQPVVAIGNALGILSNTATEGILSSITREITIEGQTMNLMQISAPINPGNSGGGCFDIKGNLIGVVNAKTSAAGIEGLGYAIPVNTAKTIIGKMIADDKSTLQKSVGITKCYEITESNYSNFSSETLLREIEKINGSPLYGIYVVSDGLVEYVNDNGDTFENGDVIKSINGKQVTTLAEVAEIVNACAVGDELTVTVLRLTQTGGFMRPTYSLEEHTFKIRVIEMYR